MLLKSRQAVRQEPPSLAWVTFMSGLVGVHRPAQVHTHTCHRRLCMHAHMHTHGGDTLTDPHAPATPQGCPPHLRGSATLTAIHTDVPQGVPSVPRPGASDP